MENKTSIGEEVIVWVEKYWLIDKILKGEIGLEEGEKLNYEYFRRAFINAINSSIKERLMPTEQPTEEGNSLNTL